MTRTKQTPHGASSSGRSGGISTARFASAKKETEQQFEDAPGKETEDSQEWPEY